MTFKIHRVRKACAHQKAKDELKVRKGGNPREDAPCQVQPLLEETSTVYLTAADSDCVVDALLASATN